MQSASLTDVIDDVITRKQVPCHTCDFVPLSRDRSVRQTNMASSDSDDARQNRRCDMALRDREKRRPPRRMKSSELSNGGNRIVLRQLLQNWKWRHLWRHNLGSRWQLQKMTRENFSIGAFYNITRNQDNPIKTVGGDSFLSPKPLKIQVFMGHPAPRGRTAPIF